MCVKMLNVDQNNKYTVPADVASVTLKRGNDLVEYRSADKIPLQLNDILTFSGSENFEEVKVHDEPTDDCFAFKALICK